MLGCYFFWKKTSRDDGLCRYAEPISELYFRESGDANGTRTEGSGTWDRPPVPPCILLQGGRAAIWVPATAIFPQPSDVALLAA
jgi:hypothetical protein